MRSKHVVSVDAHKASFTFAVFHNGEIVAGPSRRPNNPKNVRQLVRQYPNHIVVVEACGVHEWMTDLWIEEGCEVFVCKPFKMDRREKSDNRDTIRIGRRYLSGELKRVHHFSPELRLLRSLVRERSFLVEQRTQIINHIRHELNRWNLSHLDFEDDADVVLEKLPHLGGNLAILATINKELKPLTKQIEAKGKELPIVKHLTTICGFGPVVGLAFYTEIADITRFPKPESLVRYLGLDPVWNQSGDTLVDSHRISKAGNRRLRGLLLQAAWVHVRHAPMSPFSQKFRHLTQRGKPRPVAIIAVTRQLVEVAWHLWREERDFTMIRPATAVSLPAPS